MLKRNIILVPHLTSSVKKERKNERERNERKKDEKRKKERHV